MRSYQFKLNLEIYTIYIPNIVFRKVPAILLIYRSEQVKVIVVQTHKQTRRLILL